MTLHKIGNKRYEIHVTSREQVRRVIDFILTNPSSVHVKHLVTDKDTRFARKEPVRKKRKKNVVTDNGEQTTRKSVRTTHYGSFASRKNKGLW